MSNAPREGGPGRFYEASLTEERTPLAGDCMRATEEGRVMQPRRGLTLVETRSTPKGIIISTYRPKRGQIE